MGIVWENRRMSKNARIHEHHTKRTFVSHSNNDMWFSSLGEADMFSSYRVYHPTHRICHKSVSLPHLFHMQSRAPVSLSTVTHKNNAQNYAFSQSKELAWFPPIFTFSNLALVIRLTFRFYCVAISSGRYKINMCVNRKNQSTFIARISAFSIHTMQNGTGFNLIWTQLSNDFNWKWFSAARNNANFAEMEKVFRLFFFFFLHCTQDADRQAHTRTKLAFDVVSKTSFDAKDNFIRNSETKPWNTHTHTQTRYLSRRNSATFISHNDWIN